MRILLVTMQLGRGYAQGTERYVITLGRALRAAGHEVVYLAGDPLGKRGPLPSAKAPAHTLGQRVPDADAGDLPGPLHHHPTAGWMALRGGGGGDLSGWIARQRPDVVHVANPAHIGVEAIHAARALGIPVVITTMDFWWVCPKGTLLTDKASVCRGAPAWNECLACITRSHDRASARILGKLPAALAPLTLPLYLARGFARGMPVGDMARWPGRRGVLADAINAANHVIFPSSATREAIAPLLTQTASTQIPYGLEDTWFATPRAGRTGPLSPEKLTIGFAGALLHHKGAHVLLDALRTRGWKKTRVRLAGPPGDAACMARLHDLARGLAVEFTGPLSAERMPGFLRTLDVLVLPSLWPEHLPFVMLEAHAAGVPVIASRLAGVRDQIPQAELLFEPGSSADLVRALEYFCATPEAGVVGHVLTAGEMAERTLAVYAAAKRA